MKNNKIKVTEAGLKNLEGKIAELEVLVKEIQAEKAIAYTASGDGWHDNPGFNQLEQKEYYAINELQQLKITADNVVVIKIESRNTENVQIGSIVKIEQFYYKDNSIKNFIWEIVGHQESDFKQNRIAYDTPVGSAIMGKKVGETTEMNLPVGKARFKVISFYYDWNSVA